LWVQKDMQEKRRAVIEKGVWIPIEIRENNIIERTSGLVNGGYRTENPAIALPIPLCNKLDITAVEPTEEPSLWLTNTFVDVRILVRDKDTEWIRAEVHAHMIRPYIIISTPLASRMNIGIWDLDEGTWFFRDEPSKIRSPTKPRIYPFRI